MSDPSRAVPSHEAAPRRHRARRAALWGMLGLVVVVLAVFAFAVFKPSFIAEQVKTRALPQLSQKLGREVTSGPVEVSFFPPHASVKALKVAGAAGEPAFVDSGEATMSFQLWPLVTSLGKDVRIDELTLKQPALTLVRRADGTWSYEDITKRLGQPTSAPTAQAPAPAPAPAPSPSAPPSERQIEISRFRIEDGVVKVIDRAAGTGTARVAITKLQAKSDHVTLDQPVHVDLTGAFAGPKENLTAALTVDPADPKNPEATRKVAGTFALKGVPLRTFHAYLPASVGELITAGVLDLDGKISTPANGHYLVDGHGSLAQLQLRGQPADGKLDYTLDVGPKETDPMVVSLRGLSLQGPGVDLNGTAHYVSSPREAEFALRGPLLDLDALMGLRGEAPAPAAPAAPAPKTGKTPAPTATAAAPTEEPLLSPSARAALEQTTVNGTLDVDKVVNGKLTLTGFKAKASLVKGALLLENAVADLYGGKLDATGSKVDLLPAQPKWNLRAQLQGVDLADAMSQLSGQQPLEGKMTASLSLDGAGNVWEQMRKQITGDGVMQLKGGTLTTMNLSEQLRGPLSAGLAKFGAKGAAANVAGGKGTPLQDLSASFQVKDGFLVLTRPLRFNSQFGAATLGGRIGLDRALDLDGTVLLQPDFVAQLTGGSYKPAQPLEVPLELGGSLTTPKVVSVNTSQLVTRALPTEKAKAAAQDQAKKAEQEVQRRARKGLEGLFRR